MTKSIVLAAGKGTRMRSIKPKVVQKVLGTEMINLVLAALSKGGVNENTLVVGYKSDEVIEAIDQKISFTAVHQKEQLGTGHAVMMCAKSFENFEGNVLITCGDTPLITSSTYEKLIRYHEENKNDVTVLTTLLDNPYGYGRIIRSDDDNLLKIVEQKDADETEQKTKEVNTGVYIFDSQKLFSKIDLLHSDNAQKEYYLTDMIKVFIENNYKAGAFVTNNSEEVMGINDLVSLQKANKILQREINYTHMSNGVQIIDSDNTYISSGVKIGEGTIIYPGNVIEGNVQIGSNNILMPNNMIVDTVIGNNCQIGPMCYMRNNTQIEDDCRIGNFVEIKNSLIGKNTKSAHLTYIGDSEVGERVNFGCGTITANYDGKNKFKTKIGNDVFIGSNANLIAPLTIDDDVFIAAGTTLSKDIPQGKFVVQKREYEIKKNKK